MAISRKLSNLKSGNTSDVLGMDTALLKLASNLIAPSLTHIYNLSLYQGEIPNDLKIACVTPVFKNKGNRSDISNYRPISVISHIGKILEDVVKTQIVDFLSKHNLLSPNQSAYIKGKSTQTALHTVTDKWLQNIDNGLITGACFLDLSKCFDTVSHTILLQKLETFGVIKNELHWFKSYLSNRTQIVKCNGKFSKPCLLPIGVPQGTILSPLLFILYANDLFHNICTGTCVMYADDITLYCSAKSINEVQSNLQTCVDDTIKWLQTQTCG